MNAISAPGIAISRDNFPVTRTALQNCGLANIS